MIGLTLMAPFLADVAVQFGPPEFFALTVLAILMVTYLGTRSPLKSLAMAAAGLLLATVGQDPIEGQQRYTFDTLQLWDGLDFVAIAMGLFGVAELLHQLEQTDNVQLITKKVKNILPTRKDMKDSAGPIARGSVVGFFIGVLPGGGGVISSLASYAMEKKRAKDPSRFGKARSRAWQGPRRPTTPRPRRPSFRC